MEVVLIETGTANTASVAAGLRRAGASVRPLRSPQDLEAERVVLPGVGSFGAAMQALHSQGLVDGLRRRIAAGRPTLAVCVGLQLLAEAIEEDPGIAGLGIVPATVKALPDTVERPQLGWNAVAVEPVYFANSFALDEAPGFQVATFAHGGTHIAALARQGLLACQFLPELSGPSAATRPKPAAKRSAPVSGNTPSWSSGASEAPESAPSPNTTDRVRDSERWGASRIGLASNMETSCPLRHQRRDS